jgi:chromosome segregation protein
MYLKELHIQGFKSFADPVLLALKPGVTAIVGPNGCGKSNIADALRWVLGEQSTKSLRADAMSDVIFQGSSQRKALNLCEVSLLFADCEKMLGTNFNELEIARRVSREGSSDYFINGKAARLKDIQLLFMGTGVGQVSYSFLLQGRIDQILSSNPAERRAIFEEAAGISRYKTQRKDALDKLKGVEADLARVGDVLEEVTKRIGSLKRQASKAVRFKLISDRATHLELASAAWKRIGLLRDISYSESLVEGTRTRMLQARMASDKCGVEITAKREALGKATEALRQADESIFNIRSARDKAVAAAETAALRKTDSAAHLNSIRKELEDMTAEKAQLDRKVEERHEMRKRQMELLGRGDEDLDQKGKALSEVRKSLDEAERELSRARAALQNSENDLVRQRTGLARMSAELDAFKDRADALDGDMKQAEDELAKEKSGYEELTKTRETLESKVKEQDEAARKAREGVDAFSKTVRDKQDAVRTAERDLAGLAAREKMLDELQKRMEGFSEGTKAILQGKFVGTVPQDRCKLVMAGMDVDEKWASAIEMLLGQGIDAVALADAADAAKLRAALVERRIGNACLVLPPVEATSVNAATPDASGGAVAALSVVKAKDEAASPTLRALFNYCWLFPSFDAFLAWRGANPAFKFRRAATLDGCAIDGSGMVYVGQGGHKDSFLLRDAELRKMRKDIEAKQAAIVTLHEAEKAAVDAQRNAVASAETLRQQAAKTAQELAAMRGQERGTSERLQRASQRIQLRGEDRKKLLESRELSIKRQQAAKAELDKRDAETTALREKMTAMETALTGRRKDCDSQREAYETLRMEVAGKKQRLEIAHREVAEIERMLAEWAVRHQKRESDAARDAEQIGLLDKTITGERANSVKLEAELKAAHELQEKRRDAAAGEERQLRVAEKDLEAKHKASDELAATLTQQEVALVKVKTSLESLAETVLKTHNAKIEELDWKAHILMAGEGLPERVQVDMDDEEPQEIAAPTEAKLPTPAEIAAVAVPDWADIEKQAADHRKKLDSMGAVNMLAIEEYKELRDRHTFLKAQSDDLWQAREKLLAAIEEINKTSTDLFRATFEQVKKNFVYTFQTLFGGGEAALELVDSEDMLESGVEITARPPGTKLRSVALLSGGQRTMTAMALLFAIYMVKPSPFCVLDEIDAPLDEANVGRFSKMLEGFLEHSQFFIITHNKHTISTASTIYGVTMEERGVSKILSMRMEEAKKVTAEASGEGAGGDTTASNVGAAAGSTASGTTASDGVAANGGAATVNDNGATAKANDESAAQSNGAASEGKSSAAPTRAMEITSAPTVTLNVKG